jgi:Zn finger protein HypA/HybF involved in hydrogenase expression
MLERVNAPPPARLEKSKSSQIMGDSSSVIANLSNEERCPHCGSLGPQISQDDLIFIRKILQSDFMTDLEAFI